MRLLVLLVAVVGAVFAQPGFQVRPAVIHQGETLHLTAPKTAVSARLLGRTAPLFPSDDGSAAGLMPIGALEKPGDAPLEFLDAAGQVLESRLVHVLDAHYPQQNISIPPAVAALKPSDEEEEKIGAFLKTITPVRYWQEPLSPPVGACLTSLYGVARLHNGKLTGDYHKGLDQGAVFGTPIRSVTAGVVRIVQQFPEGGGTVAVDHGQGLQSIYLHMSRFQAKEGEQVAAGAVLGFVGTTGRSTGPHLHWGLYVDGVPVNPAQWMTVPRCTYGAPASAPKKRPTGLH